MKNILILHPYRETYTNILNYLPKNHHYTLLVDESKKESFISKLPYHVKLATVVDYQKIEESKQKNFWLLIDSTVLLL